MKQFNANPKHLRAAQLFQAKDDIRYYINGVFLDKERGAIYGTNGHCIISITSDWVKEIPESMIISLDQAVPAKATHAAVTMVNDHMGFIEFMLKKTVKRVFLMSFMESTRMLKSYLMKESKSRRSSHISALTQSIWLSARRHSVFCLASLVAA